jgi:hypothetical protein
VCACVSMANANATDEAFETWLSENDRSGWIEGFRLLRSTSALDWADFDDLVAIFTRLGVSHDAASPTDDLIGLFANLQLGHT